MKYLCLNSMLLIGILVSACGPSDNQYDPQYQDFRQSVPTQSVLTQEGVDYVERFNVVTKDIRDAPPHGKNIEEYFHIFKSVPNVKDAKIIFFGEQHDHSGNQIWSAALINRIIESGDVVLFEGSQGGTHIDVESELIFSVFTTREYEKLMSHKIYRSAVLGDMRGQYYSIFSRIKAFLALSVLNLKNGRGFGWDLKQGEKNHPNVAMRNEEMVRTIKNNLSGNGRVFVIAGALHLPHYEFADKMKSEKKLMAKYPSVANMAKFLATPGARKDEINMAYYDFWGNFPKPYGTNTRVIFEFLKDQHFAVLIPKNLPGVRKLENFFPKNVR